MDLKRWRSQKKQVEEMEVAEMKMLRFAMGVTRKLGVTRNFLVYTGLSLRPAG